MFSRVHGFGRYQALSSVIKRLLTVIDALSNTVLTPLSKFLPAVKLITALRFNYKWSDSDHLH